MIVMNGKNKEIASRIAELRGLSDISIDDMAKYLNMSVEVYQGYEQGTIDIPVGLLYEIAHKLDVDLGLLLTGEETRMHIFTVTRKNKGIEIERRKQYKYQNLAEKFIHKKAETFIVTVEPKTESNKPELNSHPGQEFNYVLSGSLKIHIYNNEVILNEGDCIFFDSSYDHAMEALNQQPAKFLAVIM